MSTKRFLFQKIVDEGLSEGFSPGATQRSRQWFRDNASRLRTVRSDRVMKLKGARDNSVSTIFTPGEFYLFNYDPKLKDTLPYYDRYPLVLILDVYPKGFLGLNFHYIPPLHRAKLMDQLYRVVSDNNFDEQTKLRVTYDILRSISRVGYYKPCIKRYLNSHVRSRYVKIHSAEWDIVLMLPLDRFAKANRNTVYRDSRMKYN